jgi:hypothetical protein
VLPRVCASIGCSCFAISNSTQGTLTPGKRNCLQLDDCLNVYMLSVEVLLTPASSKACAIFRKRSGGHFGASGCLMK